MSLQALVQFAQENFGALSNAPPGRIHNAKVQPDDDAPLAVRPRSPNWVGRTEEHDVLFDENYPWRIEGPIEPEAPAEVEKFGTDALAFWVPFHFYRERWGIYIRASGVLYLASILKPGKLLPGDEKYCHMAEAVLFEHELMHAMVEIACTRGEMVARRSLYQEYFADREAWQHEEALANAHAFWRTFQDDEGHLRSRSLAKLWMRAQGPGYRDFGKWLDSRKFSRGLDRAAHFMLKPLPPPIPKVSGPSKAFLFHEAGRYRVSTTRINDIKSPQVSLLRPFPKQFGIQVLVHTKDHNPPHIHIQSQQDGAETKYVWPDLVPMKNAHRLSARDEKKLRRYVAVYRTEIEERMRRIYDRMRMSA